MSVGKNKLLFHSCVWFYSLSKNRSMINILKICSVQYQVAKNLEESERNLQRI